MMFRVLVFVLAVAMMNVMVGGAPSSSDLEDVHCYVCQWSGKSGYTSPFRQSCSSEAIRAYPKHYVQKCGPGRGCVISQVTKGSTVIAEDRRCASSLTNMKQETRYCRTNDCTRTASGSGTVVAGGRIQCRKVNAGTNITLITKLSGSSADRSVSDCPDDSTTLAYQYFCSRTTIWSDVVVNGVGQNYPGPSYNLDCARLNSVLWTDSEYTVTTKACVNSLCNADISTSAAHISVTMTTVATFVFIGLFMNK